MYRKTASELLTLVQDYANLKGLVPSLVQKQEMAPEDVAEIEEDVQSLDPDDARTFNSLLAMMVFGSDDADLSSVIAASR